MASILIPSMKPIPKGATQKQREQMYREYQLELIRMNPNSFNSDGSVKSVWQSIKGLFT